MRFGFSITRTYREGKGKVRCETMAWRHYDSSFVRDQFLHDEVASLKERYPNAEITHATWQFPEPQ